MKSYIRKYFSWTNIKNFNSVYTELRSDVKTLPTQRMIEYLNECNFGDDNYEEDPSVNRLADKLCRMFKKERGLFVTSGTMGNIVGIGIHCNRDEYVIQGERSHLYKSEIKAQKLMGYKQILTNNLDNNQYFNVKKYISDNYPDTQLDKVKLIEFENSHNYTGGTLLNLDILKRIKSENPEFKYHLDGSRIWNASVASGLALDKLVEDFDTINICFSKGMGAPFGSMILMSDKDYSKAKTLQKATGGGMRQAGFMAAPVLICLEDWQTRMKNDMDNAEIFWKGLRHVEGFMVDRPQTNIVNVYLKEHCGNKLKQIENYLRENYKVLVLSFDGNSYIRVVFHHQVSKEQTEHAINAFKETYEKLFGSK